MTNENNLNNDKRRTLNMNVILSKEQAIEILECKANTRPARIKEGLKKIYDKVEKIGRGNNIQFMCSLNGDSGKQCHRMFREICINEYGFAKNFDYDKVLDTINFHYNNTEEKRALTLEEISSEIEIPKRTLVRHRDKLTKARIVTPKEQCIKLPFANSLDNIEEYKQLSLEIYNDIILVAYFKTLKDLHRMFGERPNQVKNEWAQVGLFYNKLNNSFIMLDTSSPNYDDTKKILHECGSKFIADYGVFEHRNGIVEEDKEGKAKLNEWLKRKIFTLILKEHNINNVTFKYVYTLHRDLMNDDELLEIVTRAVEYKNTLPIEMVA